MRTGLYLRSTASISMAIAFAAVAFVGAQQLKPNNANPVVTIDSGQLRGSVSDGVVSFRGVPYAAPPVGTLRWRAPQAPAKWQGVRAAENFGNDCVQHRAYDFPQSEDCLFLNVWAPASAPGA